MADSGDGAQVDLAYTLRVAKVFADQLRIKIVTELNTREMSPTQFYEEFGGGSLPRVCRHFEVLGKYDWLYPTRTESGGRRRGGVEHFYRATEPAKLDYDIWPALPKSMRQIISGGIFAELGERVREASDAGTLDARSDRHLTWTPLRIDQRGWDTVISKLDALFESLLDEQKKANLRMAKSGEEPIPMTVALTGFESPMNSKKAP